MFPMHRPPSRSHSLARQPAVPGIRAPLWCLQACTARVLMSSMAGQARAGALQHQMQLAVEALRNLQALADAGDCGLKAAVQVGCVYQLASRAILLFPQLAWLHQV